MMMVISELCGDIVNLGLYVTGVSSYPKPGKRDIRNCGLECDLSFMILQGGAVVGRKHFRHGHYVQLD